MSNYFLTSVIYIITTFLFVIDVPKTLVLLEKEIRVPTRLSFIPESSENLKGKAILRFSNCKEIKHFVY